MTTYPPYTDTVSADETTGLGVVPASGVYKCSAYGTFGSGTVTFKLRPVGGAADGTDDLDLGSDANGTANFACLVEAEKGESIIADLSGSGSPSISYRVVAQDIHEQFVGNYGTIQS